jgi:hypothetical protein
MGVVHDFLSGYGKWQSSSLTDARAARMRHQQQDLQDLTVLGTDGIVLMSVCGPSATVVALLRSLSAAHT